jgi:small subunit ribosomal protein S6
MRHYEIVALVHPNQSDQLEEIVARYRKIVEESGGSIHRYEDWGRRKLAYPIQKLYKAGYFLMNIECEPTVKDEIENAFRYNDSIIRSLVIRKEKAVTEQSPILTKLLKQEAEDREAEERATAELERARKEESEAMAAEAAKRSEETVEDSSGSSDSTESTEAVEAVEAAAESTSSEGEDMSEDAETAEAAEVETSEEDSDSGEHEAQSEASKGESNEEEKQK